MIPETFREQGRPPARVEHDLLDTPLAGSAAIRGGAMRLAGYAGGILLSIASAALLFRHLGVEDGGRYVTVLAIVSIVGGLTDVGLTTIGIREMAVREPAEREPLVRSLIGLRIALTAGGVVAAVFFTLVAGYPSVLVIGTLLAGFGLFAQNLQSTLGIALMVDLRLGMVTLLELARQLIAVVAIVTLVVVGARLLPFLAVPIPAGLVALALTAWIVRGKIPLVPSFEPSQWRALMRDILPYAAATAVAAVYFRLAIVMLSLISTSRQTGYFGASFRVIEVLVVVPQLIVSAGFPIFARAARDDRERLSYGIQRMFEACMLLGAWVSLALVTGASFVINVIAGRDFAPSISVLQIQAIALLITFGAVTWSFALLSLRQHRAILIITAGGLAVNASLVGILGSLSGARGAALATLVADGFSFVVAGIWLCRLEPAMRPRLGVVARIALAAGLAATTILIPGVTAVATIALATVVYVVALVCFRAVPEELWIEIRRLRHLVTT